MLHRVLVDESGAGLCAIRAVPQEDGLMCEVIVTAGFASLGETTITDPDTGKSYSVDVPQEFAQGFGTVVTYNRDPELFLPFTKDLDSDEQ